MGGCEKHSFGERSSSGQRTYPRKVSGTPAHMERWGSGAGGIRAPVAIGSGGPAIPQPRGSDAWSNRIVRRGRYPFADYAQPVVSSRENHSVGRRLAGTHGQWNVNPATIRCDHERKLSPLS